MALCSLLLYAVANCMVHTNSVIFQREFLDDKYKASKTPVERVKINKMLGTFTATHYQQVFHCINDICCWIVQSSADYLLKCWYAMAIFFGIIHQGGVIQLTQYSQPENAFSIRTDGNSNVYLITSHLYNIPTSYQFQPSTRTLLINPDNGQKYTRKKQIFL